MATMGPATTAETGEDGNLVLKNRLSESKSPYVRQHMNNPVAWQLWTPETLALAKKEQKLVFVSIGYAACHWCHVMERESFENNEIASLLNSSFIPIKIDREERPDVDRIYMNYVQATTGGGGWPLNVFLTPDLEPLFGGTYFPGPGSTTSAPDGVTFAEILQKMAEVWRTQRQKCMESAREITAQLRRFAEEGQVSRMGGSANGEDSDVLDLELLEEAYSHFDAKFDDEYGGFGRQPKFPTPANLQFLLRLGCWSGKEVRDVVGEAECDSAAGMVMRTLKATAEGGIKDQVGHGFARYSVTRDWSLPHFEKMLYDQPQLLSTYLDAHLLNPSNSLILETVHDIATYLTTPPLANASGGFFSSEDADSLFRPSDTEKREGAFYVWTLKELRSILGERDAEILAAYYNVQEEGNVAPQYDAHDELLGQNVLAITKSTESLAKQFGFANEIEVQKLINDSKRKLRAHREKERPRPALDDKIVTAWNGLAIGALARTATAVSSTSSSSSNSQGLLESYLSSAISAANFIRSQLYDEQTGVLKRVYREGAGDVTGFADDYAFLISGLIDLYEATFDDSWLQWADRLQKTMIDLFWDASPEDTSTTTGLPNATSIVSDILNNNTKSPEPAQQQKGQQQHSTTTGHAGFFSTPPPHLSPDLLLRLKDGMDNAEPSTNGTAALNLFRLSALLEDEDYKTKANATLQAFEAEIMQHPFLFVLCLAAVVWSRLGGRNLTIVGGEERDVTKVLEIIRREVRGDVLVSRLVGGSHTLDGTTQGSSRMGDSWLRERNPLLAAVDLSADRVKEGYIMVCERGACREVGFGEVEGLFRR